MPKPKRQAPNKSKPYSKVGIGEVRSVPLTHGSTLIDVGVTKASNMGKRDEDEFHSRCIQYLKDRADRPLFCGSLGGIPLHTHNARRMVKMLGYQKGKNDIDIEEARRGYSRICAELKTQKGVFKIHQNEWLEKVQARGSYAVVIRSLNEFKFFVSKYLSGDIPVRLISDNEMDTLCEMLASYVLSKEEIEHSGLINNIKSRIDHFVGVLGKKKQERGEKSPDEDQFDMEEEDSDDGIIELN